MLKLLRNLCLLLILGMSFTAVAQEPAPAPLSDLAARLPVPDIENYTWFTYVDLAALRETYPDARATDPEGPLSNYGIGSPVLVDLLQAEMEGMREAIGIGLQDIHQVITIGQPPSQLTVMQGTFDVAAVTSALEALGFAVDSPDGSYTRFCHPEGCENASKANIRSRNLANPFGGKIGRLEAIALIDREAPGADLLLSSADADISAAAAAAFAAETAPEGDPMTLQAVAAIESAAGDGTLAAFIVLPAREPLGQNGVADTALPQYEALAIGAYVGGEPRVEVGLIYSAGSVVENIPPVIAARLDQESLTTNRTFRSLFEDRGVSVSELSYQPLDEGWGALRLTLTTDGKINRGYGLMLRMIYQRDLGWLAP